MFYAGKIKTRIDKKKHIITIKIYLRDHFYCHTMLCKRVMSLADLVFVFTAFVFARVMLHRDDRPTVDVHVTDVHVTDVEVDALLRTVENRCIKLFAVLDAMVTKGPVCVGTTGEAAICGKHTTDLSSHVRRLLRKHYPLNRLGQGKLQLSEFRDPRSSLIAANHNKGEKIEVCCRSKQCDTGHTVGDPSAGCKLNSVDGVMEVTLHELAHSMDCTVRTGKRSDGHGPCFDQLQNFLMHTAITAGVFKCGDDSFCGIYHSKSGMCRAVHEPCDEQGKCK